MKSLAALAEGAGTSLTALSLAWTLSRPGVSSIVLGPRNVAQFEDSLAALDVEITDDLAAEIDKIVPFGRAVVPYYLDDAFADFSPSLYHW